MSENEKKEKKAEKLSRVPSEEVEFRKGMIRSEEIEREKRQIKEVHIRSQDVEQKKAQAKKEREKGE
jgi:hypothetical protein